MKRFNHWPQVAALAVTLWSSGQAGAQEQPAEPQPEHTIGYNIAVSSDYRYRGLSQSRLDPAVSGGADYTHNPSGFYVGTWLSSIKWTKDLGGDGNVEWDVYGGKRGTFGDFSYDVGGLYYWYPQNGLKPNANTFELYGQLGYGPAYVKYSHSLTNLFGAPDSKQSGYLDIGANIDVGNGFVVNLHAGHQEIRHNGSLSYNDYKIGVTKDLGICSVALSWVKADIVSLSPEGKNLGKSAALLSVSKTF
jgi:uncharacterized protein (TIGR02001 family)